MSSPAGPIGATPILSVKINEEQDVVTARQRARQISALLGYNQQDQTRLATAVSEITRNAYQYAGGGRLDFSIDLRSRPQFFWMHVSDRGPGIRELDAALSGVYISATGMGIGLSGTSRLMDRFHVDSSPAGGTTVRFGKPVPAGKNAIHAADIGKLCSIVAQQHTPSITEEVERQNREILQTLDALRLRESELERRQQDLARLNLELEETNRGLIALYAELDEKAVALKRSTEMKSRFLSHVSHEFRTPLNSVLALTRLLLERCDGELTREQEKQVSYIRDAARQLAEIVNDLLDLAKVEAGKTDIRLTNIDVSQFLAATRALMRPIASQETVTLVFDEPPPNLTLESDESKLGQILRNLISNALKFTQEGEVRVSVHLSEARNAVEFRVKDTGIGIDQKDQERIFQEFSQIEHPLQRQVKGTGLGLPLARSLAVLLGGTLAVESSVGVGSTFTLTLPYDDSNAETELAEPSITGRHSGTILIVDDEASARYLAHRLFRGTKHSIIEASDVEAVERARFEAPILILLDLVMPDRSGFEILDELKSDEMTKDIPVVIHTSKVLTEGDYARLANRHLAILPKGSSGRLAALREMRTVLSEPDLFSTEPEFN
jgi:signal transduction histidine kinase/CheY-like chemotaxis protein